MNRRKFLSFLGIGAATVAVAPMVLVEGDGLRGEPINMVPYIPSDYGCVYLYDPFFYYDEAMSKFIETIHKQLAVDDLKRLKELKLNG